MAKSYKNNERSSIMHRLFGNNASCNPIRWLLQSINQQ